MARGEAQGGRVMYGEAGWRAKSVARGAENAQPPRSPDPRARDE